MHGSHLDWAIQKERLTRHKHHWGKPGDLREHYLPRLPGLERPIDIVVECFSSDEEIRSLPAYEEELAATLTLAHGSRRARISHHLAHLYSVNGKDEPIVETPFEAVAAFRRMPLHALAIPPFLVTKRSEPELPA
jgi:hypothetical protein